MITKEEREQLESMARPGNDGRLGTHELLSRILLRVIKRCERLEKELLPRWVSDSAEESGPMLPPTWEEDA